MYIKFHKISIETKISLVMKPELKKLHIDIVSNIAHTNVCIIFIKIIINICIYVYLYTNPYYMYCKTCFVLFFSVFIIIVYFLQSNWTQLYIMYLFLGIYRYFVKCICMHLCIQFLLTI